MTMERERTGERKKTGEGESKNDGVSKEHGREGFNSDGNDWTEVRNRRNKGKETNAYVSNLPSGYTSTKLWKAFAKMEGLMDAYMPLKKNEMGRRFGFLRFKWLQNEASLVQYLNNYWLEGMRIQDNISKYSRDPKEEFKKREETREKEDRKKDEKHGTKPRNNPPGNFPPTKWSSNGTRGECHIRKLWEGGQMNTKQMWKGYIWETI